MSREAFEQWFKADLVPDRGDVAYEAWQYQQARIDALEAELAAMKAQEPDCIGWLFQHEETGLTQVVEAQQVEWGFEKNNPRRQKIHAVYAAPQAPAAQLDDTNVIDMVSEREAFEAWHINHFNGAEAPDYDTDMWEAWQARAALNQPAKTAIPEDMALVPINSIKAAIYVLMAEDLPGKPISDLSLALARGAKIERVFHKLHDLLAAVQEGKP